MVSKRSVARAANLIRAAESQASVLRVLLKTTHQQVKASCAELQVSAPPTDNLERLMDQLDTAIREYHDRMTMTAADCNVDVPGDDDDDIIIPLGGGSK